MSVQGVVVDQPGGWLQAVSLLDHHWRDADAPIR